METRTFARGRVKPSLSSIALLFFVLISNAQANGQFIVNLSTITPNTAGVQNVVQLAFSGFVGSVNSATVTVTLTPTGVGTPIGPFSPNSSVVLPGGELVITFSVPIGTPTGLYRASATGQNMAPVAFTSTNTSNLILNVTGATFASVTPSTGQQNQTLQVTIRGNLSNFVQGTTTASFGPGISVGGGLVGGTGPVTVQNATTAIANLVISPTAAPGARTVTVTTGAEVLTGANAFFLSAIPTPGTGSTQPLTCLANAGVPPIVRAEGLAELVGDIVIVCTGGATGESRLVNLQVFLNTNITSRLIGSTGETEALLVVDELGTLPGQAGAIPAIYRGQRAAIENAIVWPGVSLVSPGTGQRILRITNLRANAALIGAAATLIPNQITAFLSASPSQAMPLNNPQQTVAFVQRGLAFDVANCAGTESIENPDFAQCVGVNNSGSRNLLTGTSGDMQFSMRFQEGFQTAFKTQLQVGQIPSNPGIVYHSESGFVRATTDLPYAIGGADQGTRLVARFRNVPPGVRLFVTTGPSTGSTAGLNAALVQTGPNGEGGVGSPSSTLLAIPPTVTLNCPSASVTGVPAVEIPIVSGTGLAVWEIITSNPAAVEAAVFGIAVAYTPDLQNRIPAVGQVTAAGNFGPFYVTPEAARASAGLPVPRFSDQPLVANAFSIEACVTHLLFPFVTNQQGFDTGIAISNTSRDPFANPNDRLQSGACTINYYGQTAAGGSAPAPQTTSAPIPAGGTLTFILSSGGNFGIAGTPGFQGYLFARCDFQYAHGFAFITDGPIGTARVAEGYLGLVVDGGGFNRGTLSESLAQ